LRVNRVLVLTVRAVMVAERLGFDRAHTGCSVRQLIEPGSPRIDRPVT